MIFLISSSSDIKCTRNYHIFLLDNDLDDVNSHNEYHKIAGAHRESDPVKVIFPHVGAYGQRVRGALQHVRIYRIYQEGADHHHDLHHDRGDEGGVGGDPLLVLRVPVEGEEPVHLGHRDVCIAGESRRRVDEVYQDTVRGPALEIGLKVPKEEREEPDGHVCQDIELVHVDGLQMMSVFDEELDNDKDIETDEDGVHIKARSSLSTRNCLVL